MLKMLVVSCLISLPFYQIKFKPQSAKKVQEAERLELLQRIATHSRLRDIRKIQIGNFGSSDASQLLWQKLYDRLSKSKTFTIANGAQDSDALLSGTFVFRNTENAYDGDVLVSVARVDSKILWNADIEKVDGRLGTTISMIADAIVDGLTQAVAEDEKSSDGWH
jgi:hypothetical protein